MRARRVLYVPAALLACALACTGRPPNEAPPPGGGEAAAGAVEDKPTAEAPARKGSYLERRAAHRTVLKEDAPTPSDYVDHEPPSPFQAVTYTSDGRELKAYYAAALNDSAARPGLVYFHGDFALRERTFREVEPFLMAGFSVMLPTLRGEHGNPGRFELLYGEIDDARAAVQWLAARPESDGRVYAIGHSIGGGVAAMLSLYPELPLARTGSVGGIYVPETFVRWSNAGPNKRLIRFDPHDRSETTLRVLGPNVADMVHEHVAYVGDDDPWFIENATAVLTGAREHGRPFSIHRVPGNHMTSIPPAIADFAARAHADPSEG